MIIAHRYIILSIITILYFLPTQAQKILPPNVQAPNIDSIVKKQCCLGFREWIRLPKLFKERVMAKIDTGAKTSSLHAENITIFEKNNEEWVSFTVFPKRDTKKIKHVLESKVIEIKNVRSSNGKISIRPVIETPITIGGKTWPVEITLTDRSVMGYRMLLGRTTFQSKFLVDSAKSFILSEKNPKVPLTSRPTNKYVSVFSQKLEELKGSTLGNAIETLLTLFLIFLIRLFALSRVNKYNFHSSAAKSRFTIYIQNIILVSTLIILIIIWFNEVKSLSLYLMAMSVAFVIMMREFIKNLHGGFLLTGSKPFKIGDIVEIKDIRGEVIETNFMTTKIARFSGDSIDIKFHGEVTTLPNSVFLSSPLNNETFNKGLSFHKIELPLKDNGKWRAKEKELFDAANEVLDKLKKKDSSYADSLAGSEAGPIISYSLPAVDKVVLHLKILIPALKKYEIEGQIMELYLRKIEKMPS